MPNLQPHGLDSLTDEALAERYFSERRAHDLEALIRRNQAFAYRVAMGVCGNAALAEEAVQTAFLHLMEQGKGFRVQEGSSFRSWLYRWVVNAAFASRRAEYRIRKREQFMRYGDQECGAGVPVASGVEAPSAEKSESLESLRQALCSLSGDLRLTLILHFQEGISQSDVGRMMGVSQSQVSRRIGEGLEALRRQLGVGGAGAAAVVLPELLRQKSLLEAPASFGENLLQVCGQQTGKLAARVSRRMAAKAVVVPPHAAVWVAVGMLCVAAALAVMAWPAQPMPHAGTNTNSEPSAQLVPPPAPSAPTAPAAEPALDRVWDFSNGPDDELKPVYGRWNWRRLDATRAGMSAPKDDKVMVVLPVQAPAAPLMITLKTTVNHMNTLCHSCATWAGPRGPLPDRVHFKHTQSYSQPPMFEVQTIFFWGPYVLEFPSAESAGAIREFAQPYPSRQVCVFFKNRTVFEIRIKTITLDEVPAEYRDPTAFLKRQDPADWRVIDKLNGPSKQTGKVPGAP